MTTDTDNGGPPEDGFLSRWSRRKQAARGSDADAAEAVPEAPEAGDDPAPTLADEDMPPVESLDERSDVSGFFSRGVSEELRRKALRRIFHTSRYHHRDGLDDYDADYRSFKPLGDDVLTADLRLRQERLARRAEELLADRTPEEGEDMGGDDGDPPERGAGAADSR